MSVSNLSKMGEMQNKSERNWIFICHGNAYPRNVIMQPPRTFYIAKRQTENVRVFSRTRRGKGKNTALFKAESGRQSSNQRPFGMRKTAFYTLKGHHQACQRPSLHTVKTVFTAYKGRFCPKRKSLPLHSFASYQHNILYLKLIRLHTFPCDISARWR